MSIRNLLMAMLFTFWLAGCHHTKKLNSDLREKILETFPGATLEAIAYDAPYTRAYEIVIPQYLDHSNLDRGTFDQHLFLYHVDDEAPVHLETGGYDAYLADREISKNLKLNLIIVEYRFYGDSQPDSIPWELLTNDQAIGDYHRINQSFRKIYKKGKWLTSGISKGGETAMIYKTRYPEDADVVVPYVAPIILDTMDLRPWEHIAAVGTKNCRNKIRKVQETILRHKKEVLAMMQVDASADELTFSIGAERALEYAVLEYPFAFWQWNGDCSSIPEVESVSLDSLFNHLVAVADYSAYADQSFDGGKASYYQHMRELGYYVMDTTGLSQYLSDDHYSHRIFAPDGVDLSYNSTYMSEVKDYIENTDDKIIWIYGGLDPWGACAVDPKGKNSLKFVRSNGTHRTRIKDLGEDQQRQIYDSLRSWLN